VSRFWQFAIMAGLWALCFATFWPVLSAGFLINDDPLNITGVRQIRGLGLENLTWMFFDFGPDIRYKPITYFSWAVIYAVGGMKPFLFHLANLVLHCANSCLLFVLALRLGELALGKPGDRKASNFRLLTAGVVALFWAVQPLRVETVAWLSVLSYSLTAFFLQLAMWCFLGCDEYRSLFRQRRYWSAVGLFQLGMMSFPTAIGFSFAFLAVNIFPLRHPLRQAVAAATPFLALSALMIGVGLYGQFVAKGIWGEPKTLMELPLWLRAVGPFYYIAYYLWRPFYPVNHFTLNEDLMGVTPGDPRLWLSVMLVAGFVAWGICRRRKSPAGLAFAVAFVGTLAPVLNFTGGTPLPSDRYSLLPGLVHSVAICCLIISVRAESWQRATLLALAVYSGLIAFHSRQRSEVWKDDISFFTDRVRYTRSAEYLAQAHRILGRQHLGDGDQAATLSHWKAAWAAAPELCAPTLGEEFGDLLIEEGRLKEAGEVLATTRRMNPDDFVTGLRLAYVRLRLSDRSAAIAAVEDVVASERYARAAISDYLFDVPLTDERAQLMDLVGRSHLMRNETEDALEIYELMIEDNPDSPLPFVTTAEALVAASHRKLAKKTVERGLKQFPTNTQLTRLKASLP